MRLVIEKVNPSQNMNNRPLTPWVIAAKDGQIVSGHCNCMAGMGETCFPVVGHCQWCSAEGFSDLH